MCVCSSVAIHLYPYHLIRITTMDQSSPSHSQSRTARLIEAHPWLSSEQAYALVADRYTHFLDRYKSHDTNSLMENWVQIACNSDEHWMRDRLAVAMEWCLF